MFGLNALFRRHPRDDNTQAAHAASAPVDASVTPSDPTGRHPVTPTAPGTHISYSPDLIEKLHAEHAALLTLFVSIQACVGAQDWSVAGHKLSEFRRALQAHLLTENVRLYVYLEHMLAGDKLSHDLMHDFRRDMAEIGKDVMMFLDKYRDLAVRPDLAASFPAELIAIGAILTERIQREEDTLYPLYTPA